MNTQPRDPGLPARVPARAAINESVELVKRARKRSAAPFVNAVLRKLSNQEKEEKSFTLHMEPSLVF